MAGLNNSLKTKSSLTRKLRDDSAKQGTTPQQAAANIGDALRYTIQLPEKGFGDAANNVLKSLADAGNQPLKVSNSFVPGAPYKGVNTVFQDASGQKFELQLHTEQSLAVKEVNHQMYEEARLPGTSVARAQQLGQQMQKNSDAIPTPQGVDQIKNFRR